MKLQLDQKGFKPEILTSENHFYLVVVGKFDNRNAAINELRRIRGQINQSIWLMNK
jgi:cell division protein FtsN